MIQEIKNSVDFLNLILDVEEHNLEFVEEHNTAMLKSWDQYGNTVGLEFDLDELVAELAARGTCPYFCHGTVFSHGTQVFSKCI